MALTLVYKKEFSKQAYFEQNPNFQMVRLCWGLNITMIYHNNTFTEKSYMVNQMGLAKRRRLDGGAYLDPKKNKEEKLELPPEVTNKTVELSAVTNK